MNCPKALKYYTTTENMPELVEEATDKISSVKSLLVDIAVVNHLKISKVYNLTQIKVANLNQLIDVPKNNLTRIL